MTGPTPNFFVVGAAKSGTTALHAYLKEHPQVFLPDVKEPAFFAADVYQPPHRRLTRDGYFALYAKARGEPHIGDTSTRYLISKRAAGSIHAFNPEARIIAILRNPVEMMHALHSQMVYQGDEHLEDFEAALREEDARRELISSSDPAPILHFLAYRDAARYSGQLERYFSTFGRARVHVILFDDFARDPGRAYGDVLRFVGADATFEPSFRIVNAHKAARSASVHRFILRPPRPAQQLAGFLVPARARARIFSWARALNTRHVARPEMPVRLRRQLEAEFVEEIDRLEALLERDLSLWRSPPG